MTEVHIFGVEDKCAFLMYETWFLVEPGCVSIQFRKYFWDLEENFEILILKKTPKIYYLAIPETYGNIHICKKTKTSKAVKNSHRSTVGGGGQTGHFGSLGTNGPKFPLDPPAIISNISLASDPI